MSECCVEREADFTTKDFLETGFVGEAADIYTVLESIEDESDEIVPIDLSIIEPLIEDLRSSSTLKRLFDINDVEDRFEEAFIALCRYSNFEKNFQILNKIFTIDCRTELELDYFELMLRLEGEPNGSISNQES